MISTPSILETAASVIRVGLILVLANYIFYGIIVPKWLPQYRSYVILMFSCIAGGLIAGWIGHDTHPNESNLGRVLLALLYAIVEVIFVLIFSLFIVLNTRGS